MDGLCHDTILKTPAITSGASQALAVASDQGTIPNYTLKETPSARSVATLKISNTQSFERESACHESSSLPTELVVSNSSRRDGNKAKTSRDVASTAGSDFSESTDSRTTTGFVRTKLPPPRRRPKRSNIH